ncbi:hypothetical protein CsatB_010539 [Cannabis sativa]
MGWETLVTHPMLLFGYKYRELLSLLLTFVGALGEVRLGVLEGGFQEVGLAFHLVGCVGRRQGELIKFFELRRRSAIGTFYCLILLFETALCGITFPVNPKIDSWPNLLSLFLWLVTVLWNVYAHANRRLGRLLVLRRRLLLLLFLLVLLRGLRRRITRDRLRLSRPIG